MVLAELGSGISKALKKLVSQTIIDDKVIDEMLKDLATALISADVNIKLVFTLRENIKKNLNFEELPAGINKRQRVQRAVYEELCRLLDPGTKPFKPTKGKPNIIMFVGLQGSGKTTTCTKYALYYQKKGWRTALVCADTFRAGAFDQLKQNATKAKIPFYGSYTETDPVRLARDGVNQFRAENYEVIVVDTSGRHKQEEALFQEMEQVSAAVHPDDVVFVMDSSIGQAAQDQASAFKKRVSVGSVIITKLDGHAKGGGALSAVAATSSPITFIGTGEHFDEFEEFNADRFVSRLLGYGDMSTLIDRMKDVIDEKKQPEMVERLTQGIFTMRDMYEQLQNVLKMGPLSQVMSMIPGLSQELMPKGKEKEGQARIKKFLTIMDSMTHDEMDSPDFVKLSDLDSRIKRIARGSGRSIREIHELVDQYRLFQKMIGQMKNMNLDKMKNPRDLQKLTKQMPNMLKGMPGMQNVNMQNLMKQMTSGGGLGSLLKNFGMK
jgi:signal recognition particle subunit SRP54